MAHSYESQAALARAFSWSGGFGCILLDTFAVLSIIAIFVLSYFDEDCIINPPKKIGSENVVEKIVKEALRAGS